MWVEKVHPRDEYGRFRLSGPSGSWDKLAGGQANAAHARNMAELEGLWSRQFSHFQPAMEAGKLTPEMDAQWDQNIARREALDQSLPAAAHKKLTPHDDGTWRDKRNQVFDAEGKRLPEMLLRGAVRVGDHPGYGKGTDDRIPRSGNSDLAGGVWHRPGEYGPGRVPILRNDFGHPMGQLAPEPARSRKHRERAGAFARGEMRMDGRFGGSGDGVKLRRKGKEVRYASPEIHGAYQNDPRNPVGRMRTARKKRDRAQTVTWIQRLSDQMEGR